MSEHTQPAPAVLPNGFEDLARFRDWMVPTDRERVERRLSVPFVEVKAFYDEILPELDRILPYLQTRPPTDMSQEDANLLNLALSLVEVANAVEIYNQGPVMDGGDLRSFVSVIDKPLEAGSAA
ncbi:hypothetical protein ACVGVM_19690 [Pseudonocardia bannensis]|uniref:Uncharacterized protein n=1 Tax=Pseudonocardia bannensis TaxID=630973 RepID=A0A848DH86_9PSEU|nr:hypothetical protein [Pseudonocardia bannensis]NMH92017.1 hypothetical protein [Pseudonocardia bannensis]